MCSHALACNSRCGMLWAALRQLKNSLCESGSCFREQDGPLRCSFHRACCVRVKGHSFHPGYIAIPPRQPTAFSLSLSSALSLSLSGISRLPRTGLALCLNSLRHSGASGCSCLNTSQRSKGSEARQMGWVLFWMAVVQL